MADLKKIEAYANKALVDYKLTGWKFKYSVQSTNRFGVCRSGYKVIELNPLLTSINTEERCHKVILHEIAHAIVGAINGHNQVWKDQMVRMGLTPDRCWNSVDTTAAPTLYTLECKCGAKFKLNRVRKNLTYLCTKCRAVLIPVKNVERIAAQNAAKYGFDHTDIDKNEDFGF